MTPHDSTATPGPAARGACGPWKVEDLLRDHLPWLRAYVHRRLGSFARHKAETGDIVQDAMVQFLRHGPRLQLTEGGHWRALLARIVANVLSDNYDWFTAKRRAMCRERPLPPDTVLNLDPPVASVDSPSQVAAREEEEGWVRLALELLPPQERRIVILHKWEERSFAEIAGMLGLSKSTARRSYLNAMNLLIDTVDRLKTRGADALLSPDGSEETDS